MRNLFGRRKIYTATQEITEENVISELNSSLEEHFKNLDEENYLYWYRRGKQPVLGRTKEIRPEINSKVVQNVASEIVAFKNGYFLTKPTFYVARRSGDELADKVNVLNDYLYTSGKQETDNALVDWLHTVGIGVLFVDSSKDEDAPVKAYAVDPRQAFVVYSRNPGNAPIMGVNIVATGKKDGSVEEYLFDVYTKDTIFRLQGGVRTKSKTDIPMMGMASNIISIEGNLMGDIPIIEYTYDRNRMGAFEVVLPLLDALNDIQSNREDGIAQFIQSLMVFYNCQLGEDENGNAITPSYIRESGAIFLKSVGQDRADLKILSEQLDQIQTQTLVNDLMKQICDIAGIPFTSEAGTSDSSNNGAVYLRNGWQTADTYARNTEDLYKESDKIFTKIFLNVLAQKSLVNDVKVSDLDVQFTRNEMENLLVKTQGALNLKQIGLSPELVLAKSGISNDPVKDVEMSREYIDKAFATQEEINPLETLQKGNIDSEEEDGDKANEGADFGDRKNIE